MKQRSNKTYLCEHSPAILQSLITKTVEIMEPTDIDKNEHPSLDSHEVRKCVICECAFTVGKTEIDFVCPECDGNE